MNCSKSPKILFLQTQEFHGKKCRQNQHHSYISISKQMQFFGTFVSFTFSIQLLSSELTIGESPWLTSFEAWTFEFILIFLRLEFEAPRLILILLHCGAKMRFSSFFSKSSSLSFGGNFVPFTILIQGWNWKLILQNFEPTLKWVLITPSTEKCL